MQRDPATSTDDDSFHYILSFLGPHEVMQARRVSTTWRNIIDAPNYANLEWKERFHRHFPDQYRTMQTKGIFPENWLSAFKKCESEEYVYRAYSNDSTLFRFPTQRRKLFIACKNGDNDALLKLFPSLKLDELKQKDHSMRLAAYYAFRNGYHSTCELLYQQFVLKDKTVNSSWQKRFEFALLTFQSVATISALAREENAELNTCLDGINTPLTFAITLGRKDLIDTLINAGANVNQRALWFSPIEASLNCKQVEIAEILLEHGIDIQQNPKLMLAAGTSNDCRLVRRVFELGANINCLSEYGATPIYYAIAEGRVEMVKQLLELGASLERINFLNYSLRRQVIHSEIALCVIQAMLTQFINTIDIAASPLTHEAATTLLAIINGEKSPIHLLPFTEAIAANHALKPIYDQALQVKLLRLPTAHERDEASIKQKGITNTRLR